MRPHRSPILTRLLALVLFAAFPVVGFAQVDSMTEMSNLTMELMEAQSRGEDLSRFMPRIEAALQRARSDPSLPPEVRAMIEQSLLALQESIEEEAPQSAGPGTGYFAFQHTATPQDQDHNLQRYAGGSFMRVPGSGSGRTFNDVCRVADPDGSQGLRCQHVVDWEGTRHSCGASADDGSRIAYCGGGSAVADQGDQSFSARRRAANEQAAKAIRQNARTITFTLRADNECNRRGAFLGVQLRVEGAIVEERNGITQHVTGVWFGDIMPYVEGFGGLQVPDGSTLTASGHWDNLNCRPKTFELTYDTRRHGASAPVDFHWSSSFEDYTQNRNGANTFEVQDSGVYSYKGSGR